MNHRGQMEAWASNARILAIFAGWQSGKTVAGPHLLLREISRRGPGDYAAIAPSYPLLNNKALPELIKAVGAYFEHKRADNYMKLKAGAAMKLWGKELEQGEDCRILLRHTQDPDAVEAFTALALWADEPGQMADDIWDSIQARCAVTQARIILTSRPYRRNWYVRELWDNRDTDPDINVVNFRSIDNPTFPEKEYLRQKSKLPAWKFQMLYDGIPSQPVGRIYDCVDPLVHEVKRFKIHSTWKRHVWVDFGNNNTAALKVAEEELVDQPSRFYIYGEYKSEGRVSTAENHIVAVKNLHDSSDREFIGVGGSHQEDGWRHSWTKSGLHVKEPPINRIDQQIERVYELFATDRLFYFDDLEGFIKEIDSYAWPTDSDGNVSRDDKPDNDTKFHYMAALRYGGSSINPPKTRRKVAFTIY